MPDCNQAEETVLVNRARALLATYEDMAELIRIGAYKPGSDPEIDEAIRYYPHIEAFLAQDRAERSTLDEGYGGLAAILGLPWPDEAAGAAALSPDGATRAA